VENHANTSENETKAASRGSKEIHGVSPSQKGKHWRLVRIALVHVAPYRDKNEAKRHKTEIRRKAQNRKRFSGLPANDASNSETNTENVGHPDQREEFPDQSVGTFGLVECRGIYRQQTECQYTGRSQCE
jgi:hypothetical protein